MPPTCPNTMTDLAAQILAVVAANAGITTNILCREVKIRKSDVLAELDRLRQEQLCGLSRAQGVPSIGTSFPAQASS